MTDDETRADAELRGLVLKFLYDLHSKSEWVNWDNLHELSLPQQEIGRYLKELHELGLAEGKFVTRDNEYSDVQARVRARGADAIENSDNRPSAIIINQAGHGLQHMVLDIEKLNAAIDDSSAIIDEKAEAKSLLQGLNQNKLLTELLQKWFTGLVPR